MSTSAPAYSPGLEGIVAAETQLSHVDGEAGKLILAGLPVEVLAPTATFEETVHLFWEGSLPSRDELDRLQRELADRRELPAATHDLLRAAARAERRPDGRAAHGGLDAVAPARAPATRRRTPSAWSRPSPPSSPRYWRLRTGEQPIAPDPSLGHAANYLYMLDGKRPHARRVRALDTYLNTVVDHGLNASTFTARVIISTGSDLVSAVTGAVGALKGPLHGGAPGPALDMVFEIGDASRAEAVLRRKIERGERLMGFGHRVYKVRDPRADVLSRAAADACRRAARRPRSTSWRAPSRRPRCALLEEIQARARGSRPTSSSTPRSCCTASACPRSSSRRRSRSAASPAGPRTASSSSQANRLIRPASIYTGEEHGRWTPIEQRA